MTRDASLVLAHAGVWLTAGAAQNEAVAEKQDLTDILIFLPN